MVALGLARPMLGCSTCLATSLVRLRLRASASVPLLSLCNLTYEHLSNAAIAALPIFEKWGVCLNSDFLLQQKIYDMILYGNQCLKQFPKAEKFILAAEIRQSMYRLLRLVVETNKKYYKKTTAQQLDVELDILRTYIRLASDKSMKYLPLRKYEHWSKLLNEIGRMIGGWMKTMNK